MENAIRRSISEPIRPEMPWDDTWLGPDEGMIRCWERGREMHADGATFPTEFPDDKEPVSAKARRGEFPRLPWKGGHDPTDKKAESRVGALQYLAMWQGLRGEDLCVDLSKRVTMVCPLHGTKIRFRRITVSKEAKASKPRSKKKSASKAEKTGVRKTKRAPTAIEVLLPFGRDE